MSDKLLELKSIRKSFAGVTVLEDISLSVGRGEVVSIIGPSGSGKSTLLRCATMLNDIDAGEIVYMGRKAATTVDGHAVYAPKKELKEISRTFGLVFQNFNLFPHYSVLKNIMDAPVSVAHVDKNEAKERALTLLDQFGLSDKANSYPCELSGGQQQRVSIARALALKPEILFFDEPTSALDPELTGEVLKVIKQLAAEHMTMIIVTHEMQFAREVSDRIVFIENGVVVADDSPEAIFTSDNTRVREFIGKFTS